MITQTFDYYKNKLDMALKEVDGTDYHKKETHEKRDSAIRELYYELKAIPPAERTYEINMLLVRITFNSLNKKSFSHKILLSLQEKGGNDPIWHYYMGNILFCKRKKSQNDMKEALKHFKYCLQYFDEKNSKTFGVCTRLIIETYVHDLEKRITHGKSTPLRG
jgi:hypothetical protein